MAAWTKPRKSVSVKSCISIGTRELSFWFLGVSVIGPTSERSRTQVDGVGGNGLGVSLMGKGTKTRAGGGIQENHPRMLCIMVRVEGHSRLGN